MTAGDAEIERLQLHHAALQIERRVYFIERELGGHKPLALEVHLHIDRAQTIEIVGLGG